jgi:hypothetical protein
VGGAVGGKASLRVFAEKPDKRDAILAEHFVSLFVPFCWGDPERVGPAPKAIHRCYHWNPAGRPPE